jgi:hypothetical protein
MHLPIHSADDLKYSLTSIHQFPLQWLEMGDSSFVSAVLESVQQALARKDEMGQDLFLGWHRLLTKFNSSSKDGNSDVYGMAERRGFMERKYFRATRQSVWSNRRLDCLCQFFWVKAEWTGLALV